MDCKLFLKLSGHTYIDQHQLALNPAKINYFCTANKVFPLI